LGLALESSAEAQISALPFLLLIPGAAYHSFSAMERITIGGSKKSKLN
jgi:hypothetical protein